MWQVYFSDSVCASNVTDFVLHDLLGTQINYLLTDERFIGAYGEFFEQGITGWKFLDETTIVVQYWSWCEDYAELSICFNKLTVI